ncbi:MoaD/ThiS family protein [uncultured Desulfosarcina sp.]|uniref:sulfur carrier protein ThiS n=1 Tax=uncultured Desulfosarcina sp. TaxID=218289 RepID=UPI0029C6FD2C|nr:MoaD/ThiS family protein [uncultured Desulfosarcina sp.]
MVYLDDIAIAWREGMTVADLLDSVAAGCLYAVVKLDGRLVSRPHFESTPVPDGSRVTPLPMIAGG